MSLLASLRSRGTHLARTSNDAAERRGAVRASLAPRVIALGVPFARALSVLWRAVPGLSRVLALGLLIVYGVVSVSWVAWVFASFGVFPVLAAVLFLVGLSWRHHQKSVQPAAEGLL